MNRCSQMAQNLSSVITTTASEGQPVEAILVSCFPAASPGAWEALSQFGTAPLMIRQGLFFGNSWAAASTTSRQPGKLLDLQRGDKSNSLLDLSSLIPHQ